MITKKRPFSNGFIICVILFACFSVMGAMFATHQKEEIRKKREAVKPKAKETYLCVRILPQITFQCIKQ